MVNDKCKLKVIFFIDRWSPIVQNSIYYKELMTLRDKYVYKDIGINEYNKDITYLKNIKDMILWSYHYKNER